MLWHACQYPDPAGCAMQPPNVCWTQKDPPYTAGLFGMVAAYPGAPEQPSGMMASTLMISCPLRPNALFPFHKVV